MTEHIKRMLQKVPLLYAAAQLIKYRKDSEYIASVQGLRNNPNFVELKQQSYKLDGNKVVCLIKVSGKANGFFACVRWALDGLYFCDKFGFVPYVLFDEDSLYKDSSMPANINPFMYFFDEPYEVDIAHVHYIKYNNRSRLLAEMLNGGMSYEVSDVYIKAMAEMMEKYLCFNIQTQTVIDSFIHENKLGPDVLGVHIRGTDYKLNYKDHPVYVSPDDYYPYIREALSSGAFSKIYLATDDNEIMNLFMKEFGEEKILYAKNARRVEGTTGVHVGNSSPYQGGLDVICDMAALSYCGGIVSSLSQVGLIARIYKLSRNESFTFDQRISKGINKTGKRFSV